MPIQELTDFHVEQTGRGWVARMDEPKLAVRDASAEAAIAALKELVGLVRQLASSEVSDRAEPVVANQEEPPWKERPDPEPGTDR